MPCVPTVVLQAFAARELAVDEQLEVMRHLESCDDCRQRLGVTESTQVTRSERAVRPEQSGSVPRGTSVGRYLTLDPIGQGGMGLVYAAFDPELDRKVAIKLLRADLDDPGSQVWRARLVREAQAMARLSHPNVVAVYDVGVYEDRLFLAMELVEGGTLKSWLRASKRSWREVLEVFRGAGRGLAAAHRAGLVHRDFKPDNVLIDHDGRPRVTDFGLVRAASALADPPTDREPREPSAPERSLPASPSSGSIERPITRHGTVMGTPGYMSPEQSQALPTDVHSDQFSFCASLYEALYGERAFGGRSFDEMMEQLKLGRVREAPRDSDVPAWLRRVVVRGLSPLPAARHPSMDALLDALAHDPRRARNRWLLAATGLLLLGAGGFVVRSQTTARARLCKDPGRKLTGVWDEQKKRALESAFRASGRVYAEHAGQEVERTLDAYTSSWVTMHEDACEATRLRGEQSEEVMSLRMACLEDRREDLEALTHLFESADAETVEGAVQAARGLAPVRGCGDIGALTLAAPPAPEASLRPRVDAVRAALSDARALLTAGKYKEGLAVGNRAAAEAIALHYRPVEAEAQELLGRLRQKSGEYKGAGEAFKSAVWAAEESRLDALKTAAAVRLAVVSVDLSGFAAAHDWLRWAESAAHRSGAAGEQKVDLDIAISTVWFRESRYPEAERAAREAVREAEKTLAPDHLTLASAWRALGETLAYQARYAEALAALGKARAITEKVLGAEHPEVGVLFRKEADVYGLQRDGQKALESGRRALAIFERSLPPDHLSIAQARTNLAESFGLLGRYQEALAEEERALPTYLRIFGPKSENVGVSYTNLGYALSQLGRTDEARERLRRAVEIYDQTLAPDCAEKGEPLLRLGELELRARKPERAIAPLERALALRAHDQDPCEMLASVQFALARALWEGAGDRARSLELAGRAQREWATGGKSQSSAEARAWLAARGHGR